MTLGEGGLSSARAYGTLTAAEATAGDRHLGDTWVSILLVQAVDLRQFL